MRPEAAPDFRYSVTEQDENLRDLRTCLINIMHGGQILLPHGAAVRRRGALLAEGDSGPCGVGVTSRVQPTDWGDWGAG